MRNESRKDHISVAPEYVKADLILSNPESTDEEIRQVFSEITRYYIEKRLGTLLSPFKEVMRSTFGSRISKDQGIYRDIIKEAGIVIGSYDIKRSDHRILTTGYYIAKIQHQKAIQALKTRFNL